MAQGVKTQPTQGDLGLETFAACLPPHYFTFLSWHFQINATRAKMKWKMDTDMLKIFKACKVYVQLGLPW